MPNQRFTTFPVLCAVCADAACGEGFAPSRFKGGGPHLIAWACRRPQCRSALEKAATMTEDAIDRHRKAAAIEAGREAGRWLLERGETDIAKLALADYQEFCGRLIEAARADLARRMTQDAPAKP